VSRIKRLVKSLICAGLATLILIIIDTSIFETFDLATIKYGIGFGLGLYLGSGWIKEVKEE